ncbi:MAG TPA: single-stranded-DNA-specific exonuclease RecJ [Bryobacteraceae bacterium]|nr:single-stranded-DNA-specific exonuclease RecJ [Bryobacteraceae bacterium]
MVPDFSAEADRFVAGLGPGFALAGRVLWHRDIRDLASAQRFFAPSLADLHDPFALAGMQAAADRIARAIAEGEPILLYGDYDVDGTTSIVMLMKLFELAGAKASFHVPHRIREGYGMRSDVVDRAAAEGVRLIVSVDTGIRARAVVEHARTLGIDVIVTDHHLPEEELPPALAVINPNRPDCTYPEKNLCGAGVAFKLVQALMNRLAWPADRVAKLSESFLKITALATVADVVPLTGENRTIVKRGLEGFSTVRNVGLRELLRVAGFADGSCPTSTQVAFRIAPRINAAGRMASASDVIRLFLTSDTNEAAQIAQQLDGLNRDRQQTEQDIIEAILNECEQMPVTPDRAGLVFSGKGWHKGVVGIVASRLVERFCRPAFVLCEEEETGIVSGSGRSVARFHLLEALESMRELFEKFGGHRQAAGVTLTAGALDLFRERFNAYAGTLLTEDDFRPMIEIDAVITLPALEDRAVYRALDLAPFGCGNPAPVFAAFDAEVVGHPAIVKEKLLKFMVRQNGRLLPLKAWRCVDRADELQPGARIDVAFCVEEDDYSARQGLGGWAATAKDFRSSQ